MTSFMLGALCLLGGLVIGVPLGAMAVLFIQRLGEDVPGEDYSYELGPSPAQRAEGGSAPAAPSAQGAPVPDGRGRLAGSE